MKILGLGRQNSLRSLVELAEKEYGQAQAAPGRLMLTAGEFEIQGDRSKADGPLDDFVLRMPLSDLVRDAALHIQRQYPELCSISETPRHWEIAFRRPPPDIAA